MVTVSRRYCGRAFTAKDVEDLQNIVAARPDASRAELSRIVCEQLGWRRADGRPKDMSCRVAMLRMQSDGLIKLPPPRNGNGNGRAYTRRTRRADPPPELIVLPARRLRHVELERVGDRASSHLWNEYVDRYHYLGYQPLPGAQVRYFARVDARVVALLGFGAAAWKTAPRDDFIGWSPEHRRRNLHLVVNNARFLILPWVRARNLASRLLSTSLRRLPDDWDELYGYRPVLAETFVEIARFRGTCYKASNWIHLGETQGRGKLDVEHKASLPTKSVWVRPLLRDFRRRLLA